MVECPLLSYATVQAMSMRIDGNSRPVVAMPYRPENTLGFMLPVFVLVFTANIALHSNRGRYDCVREPSSRS